MTLPKLFGSYLLHHELATSETSEVLLAQTTSEFPRLCVVKRLRAEISTLPDFTDRFRSDATLLVRLIHGNIVQVLEVGTVDGQPFVAMEHIDGVDARDFVRDVDAHGPIPPEAALYIGLEMCEAVAYLQMRRREQANAASFLFTEAWALDVMVSFDGAVKLIAPGSFGALRLGRRQISQIFRSPGYATPEVVRKQPLDARSDAFALGVVIWELLEGRQLIAGDPEQYIQKVLDGTWRAPELDHSDIPRDVHQLLAAMLNIHREQRPLSLEAVRAPLVSALRDMAPTYGSSELSRLLLTRYPEEIGASARLTDNLMRRAATLRGPDASAGRTLTFGAPGAIARPIPEPATLQPGDRFPGTRYRMVRSLGQGGSAEVFAAQHVDLDRQVAIKVLAPELATQARAISSFRLEARTCSYIGHPNIVDVSDFGELSDGRFFFAMELLKGHSLGEVLSQQRRLPAARAIAIFRQIAKALQAAHEHGVIHRDLKPENVMLVNRNGRSDFVKVLDFGVMAFAADHVVERVGTPGYMAPEQVRGDRPDPRMDIYAMGATLYEALCGQLPYPAETIEAYLEQQRVAPPPALRSRPGCEAIPDKLEQLVHRAMERDPDARYASAAAFEAALLQAQRTAGLVTAWDDLPAPPGLPDHRPPPKTPATRREKPTRWPRLGVASAIALALVIIALRFTVFDRHNDDLAQQEQRQSDLSNLTQATQRPLDDVRIQQLLQSARAAAAEGQFSAPPGTCALDQLREVLQARPNHRGANRLRRHLASWLSSTAHRLQQDGLTASARILDEEAHLFDTALTRAQSGGVTQGKRKRLSLDRVRRAHIVAQVQLAVQEERYISPPGNNALYHLKQLQALTKDEGAPQPEKRALLATLDHKAARLAQTAPHKARQVYRLIAKLHPGSAPTRQRSAKPPTLSRRSMPAVAQLNSITATQRQRARALIAEGRTLLRQRSLVDARERFEAAIVADARNPQALVGLAEVAFQRSDYAQAVTHCRRAIAMDKQLVRAHVLMGDAYAKLFRKDKATRAWRRALALDPTNRIASDRLAHLSPP